ncbi:hypothetical protein PAEVO_05450 [Paenibacillus sp. GM2FR]|nr:hypothetical protein PAEVO_05450 [Paenibacillus sp. GM2FR]
MLSGEKCGRGLFYFFLTTIDIGKVGKEGIWYRERIGYRMTSMAQSSYVGAATSMSKKGQVSNEDDEQTKMVGDRSTFHYSASLRCRCNSRISTTVIKNVCGCGRRENEIQNRGNLLSGI